MPEFTEQLDELNKKLDSTLEAATAAQSKVDELGTKAAATDSTVQKAIEDSAKAAEEAQALKLKVEAVENTAKYIEKAISRLSPAGDNQAKEMEARAKDEFTAYLRKRDRLSDEIVELTCRAITEKTMHGISKEDKEKEVKQLISGSNPDGGYWIRPERSATMIQRIFESSPVRSIADIQTTSSKSLEFIIDDDEAGTGGWVGEVQSRPETSTPKIGMLTIVAHEQYAEPKATQTLLDDVGFDVESWLSGKVTRRMTRTENTAFVSGDGSQKPKGFLSLPAWASPSTATTQGTYERHKLEQINSGVNAGFDADTIKLLQNSLIEEYQASAIWGLKRVSWQNIITLKDGQGQYLLDPRSMKVGDTLTLLGKRVVFMNDMPQPAQDSLSLVYGDFGVGYTIVDRIGFRVIRDNVTDKPNIKFYTTKRTGGDVTNFESIKIYKLTA